MVMHGATSTVRKAPERVALLVSGQHLEMPKTMHDRSGSKLIAVTTKSQTHHRSSRMMRDSNNCEREHDFALVIGGVDELNQKVEDALFEAGCDDATFSIKYGLLYAEFSRNSKSLKDAILSAIHDVRKANINADVIRVDECNLVTQSDIARRIGRSRQ